MDEFDKAMKDYREKFGEPIALMMIQSFDPDELIAEIRECIRTGKPYKYPEYPDDAIL